jgi:hypothetical protein
MLLGLLLVSLVVLAIIGCSWLVEFVERFTV